VERVLRVRDVLGVVVPSVVSDVLRRLLELLERFIEDFGVLVGNVEFDLDVPNNLHTSLMYLNILISIYSDGGVRLAFGRGLCHRVSASSPTSRVGVSASTADESRNLPTLLYKKYAIPCLVFRRMHQIIHYYAVGR